MSYAADKQTNRQTDGQADSKILPTPTNTVGVGNEEKSGLNEPEFLRHYQRHQQKKTA